MGGISSQSEGRVLFSPTSEVMTDLEQSKYQVCIKVVCSWLVKAEVDRFEELRMAN